MLVGIPSFVVEGNGDKEWVEIGRLEGLLKYEVRKGGRVELAKLLTTANHKLGFTTSSDLTIHPSLSSLSSLPSLSSALRCRYFVKRSNLLPNLSRNLG